MVHVSYHPDFLPYITERLLMGLKESNQTKPPDYPVSADTAGNSTWLDYHPAQ